MRDGAHRDFARPAHSTRCRRGRYYLYMMLPAIIVLACITLYPFFWLIWMSLHDVDVGAAGDKWNDFKNLDPPRPRREVHRWLVPARQVQRHVHGRRSRARRGAGGDPQPVALREDPGHDLPDADDDGAGGCRSGLVLPLQLDLRLVPLADAERGHSSAPSRSWADPSTAMLGHRHRRHLAMDTADHPDHPGRPEAGAARPARGEHGRRRRRDPQLLRRSPCPISTRSC